MSRLVVRLILVAGLVLAVGSAPASAQSIERGGVHADASEGSALDLVGASLGQRERDLVLTLRMRVGLDPRLLAASGSGELCTTFQPESGASRRLCLSRVPGAWRLTAGSRSVTGTVGRPAAGTLVVRIDPGLIGLQPGALRWSVFARAAGCAATGAQVPCGDRAPDSGSYAGRVWRAAVTGCTAGGAAQVSTGPRGKRIALTYDDGPSIYTPRFLDELKRLGVPATFFLIGRQVAANAAIVRRMLADGHMVGNHSWNHADLGGGGPAATTQIAGTQEAIRRASGFTPCLFRPPYGATGHDLVARARDNGLTSVLWSVDPSDWQSLAAGTIFQRVVSHVGPGAIILEHDGGGVRTQTLGALPQIVAALRSRGYRFVTVTALLGYPERVTLRR